MKGIELCEKFYIEFGKPMLNTQFADVEKYLAIGLVGSGSECMGFDDDISHDHDFEPGFCIFLPDENVVDTKTEFELERAYAKLPEEYLGFKRCKQSPVGGNRHGVIRISDFFKNKVGDKNADISSEGWFCIDEQFLIETTNGKLFCDNYGLMTDLRNKLAYLPQDVRLKKLAGNVLLMAQSGQYNYFRCIKRNETAAAQLAIGEFVNATLKVIFLLNRKYMPYYKWSFRALSELQLLSDLYSDLELLISSGNKESDFIVKKQAIEKISAKVVNVLKDQKLSNSNSIYLENHAYSVNNCIKDANIRNLNILYAV